MFEVGDRVVCVDAKWSPLPNGKATRQMLDGVPMPLIKGAVYTVIDIGPSCMPGFYNGAISVFVAEAKNLTVGGQDGGWRPDRFRKLRDISQSLRELKELAINCPALEPVARAREGK